MRWKQSRYVLFSISYAAVVYVMSYHIPRTEFIALMVGMTACYALACIQFLLSDEKTLFQYAIALAVILRSITIFAIPNLSDDFYRFLYDGHLLASGLNPFGIVPSEFDSNIQAIQAPIAEWLSRVYESMNSKDFYTVYPPLLQLIFLPGALLFPGNLLANVVALKVIILAAEILTLFFMVRALDHLGKDRRWILLYALNPFIILELTGNIHFEALMITFLMGMFYLLLKRRFLPASVLFALAINAKLLPLMLIPYFAISLEIRMVLRYGAIVLLVLLAFFLPFFYSIGPAGILDSLQLYFDHFEFNASLYNLLKALLESSERWHLVEPAYQVMLYAATAAIIAASLIWKSPAFQSFPVVLLATWTIYLATATTVHPWYIAPLIAFAIFTNFTFPYVWGFMIVLTYITYSSPEYSENKVVVMVEYLVVALVLAIDLYRSRYARRKTGC